MPNFPSTESFEQDGRSFCPLFLAAESHHYQESHLIYGPLCLGDQPFFMHSTHLDQRFPVEYKLDVFYSASDRNHFITLLTFGSNCEMRDDFLAHFRDRFVRYPDLLVQDFHYYLAALINLDQSNAFDRVDHRFWATVLETAGFKLEFRKWISMISYNQQAVVQGNGKLLEAFAIEQSVCSSQNKMSIFSRESILPPSDSAIH